VVREDTRVFREFSNMFSSSTKQSGEFSNMFRELYKLFICATL